MDTLTETRGNMNPIDFYQHHLNQVSRSFAFCIERLQSPLRSWVSLTYLVCRILDTVEDAPWKKSSQQLAEFDRFDRWLKSPEELALAKDWQKAFPQEIAEGEKSLLRDSSRIFRDLHGFPARVRSTIQDLVGTMSAGMRYFTQRRVNGQLRLTNILEVNQYCFFVAGVVGETLTQLLSFVDNRLSAANSKMVNAYHFGLFLQKVNLLKDQRRDEGVGRFLIPSREEVWQSLNQNAKGAWEYLDSIPLEQKEYRLFCSWSLFLGLASLPFIRSVFTENESLDFAKISRQEALGLFQAVENVIDQPQELKEFYLELLQAAGLNSSSPRLNRKPVSGSFSNAEKWQEFYHGPLTQEDFVELGLLA